MVSYHEGCHEKTFKGCHEKTFKEYHEKTFKALQSKVGVKKLCTCFGFPLKCLVGAFVETAEA